MAKYREIAGDIQRQITEGIFPAGSRLPSENELCGIYRVSRDTVRRALRLLEENGKIQSRQGSGTFVTEEERELPDRTKNRPVAVVTTYVDNYIFPKIIQGIEQVLSEQGFQMQLMFTNNRSSREEEILRELLTQDLAGVIMEATRSALPGPNLSYYEELERKGVPVLFINSGYPELSFPVAALDDVETGRMAAGYLIGKGHRRLGGIFKLDDGQGVRRYQGFLKGMREEGVRADDTCLLWFDTEDMGQFSLMEERICRRLASCSAIMCYNDSTAAEVMEIFKRRGIRVPQDISIVSVDNTELAVYAETGLTSIHHPKEKLGQKAAELLISMIRSGRKSADCIFEPLISERESVLDLRMEERE